MQAWAKDQKVGLVRIVKQKVIISVLFVMT
jgi:hypothetical protein